MSKGLLIVTNNIEDGEALFTRALLIRGGLDIDTVSILDTKDLMTAYGLKFRADYLLDEVNLKDYQFLIVPGGKYVALTIDNDQAIKAIIKDFNSQNKMIAAICAGPRFLGVTGVLDHKHYVAYPGSEKDGIKGFYEPNSKVSTDGNIITARSAGAVYEFAYEILKKELGSEKADLMYQSIIYK